MRRATPDMIRRTPNQRTGGDGLMKDEDRGEEAEDVADAEQRVGQGEIVVAKDVEP